MVREDELQGFFMTERILDAVEFLLAVENRRPPAPNASKNCPVRGDKNRLGQGLIRQSCGLIKFICYTNPAEFIQRGMQPQLSWETSNRTTAI